MTTTDIMLKIIIPAVSWAFTLYLIRSRYRLEDYIKKQIFNWHHHIALLLGDSQRAFAAMKDNRVSDAINSTGKVKGAAQVLLKESAMLVCYYERPSVATVDRWVKEGRIPLPDYVNMFKVHAKERFGLLKGLMK